MKNKLIVILCILSYTLGGQSVPSLNLGYTSNSLVGGQLELGFKMNLYTPVFLEITGSTNLNSSNSLSFGIGIPVYEGTSFNIQTTFRTVLERFNEASGARQITYNYELPIELNYRLTNKFFLNAGLIPTYNTYDFKGSSIILGFKSGIGYNF